MAADFLLYQLGDSGFPTGGFAHSAGLEAAVQQGGAEALEEFVADSVHQVANAQLRVVRAAHDSEAALSELDARMDAFLSSEVSNRASRTQGRAFLSTCAQVFPEALQPLRARAKGTCLHHAPLFGSVLAALGVSAEDAGALFLSLHLRAVLSAAVRLGLVGPLESQRLQHQFHPLLQDVMSDALPAPSDAHPLVQTAPLLELMAANHDRLYTRLFQS